MEYKFLVVREKPSLGGLETVAQVNVTGMGKKEIDKRWDELEEVFAKELYVSSLVTQPTTMREFLHHPKPTEENKIEAGEYYWTTCDSVYGLSRKTLIYVTKINNVTFNYLVADWSMVSDEGVAWEIDIHSHYPRKRRGRLDDYKCFSKMSKEFYTVSV